MSLDNTPLTVLPKDATPKKKKRIFLWFFLAVQALFVFWLVAGMNSASGVPEDCGTLSAQACNDAESVGAGIGVFLIFVFWFFVNTFLGVGYGVYRLATKRNND